MQRMPISIHALARRATSRRRPERGVVLISIHALARRATKNSHKISFLYRYFNPRSRKESDRTHGQFIFNVRGFQSTLSQGERL